MDYSSEKDFTKKFKLISHLTPLTIGTFANSPIKENKLTGYLSYRANVWQNTARGGLPKIFLENMDFEKYADFIMKQSLLFILFLNWWSWSISISLIHQPSFIIWIEVTT